MNLEKISKYLLCRCGSELILRENIFQCKKCPKYYQIKNQKIFTTDQFIKLNEWNHNEFNFDLFEREKKPNMPDVIGGPRLRDLVSTLGIDKKDDFLALNLGGGKDKFENVINIDIGNYENVDIISSLDDLPIKDKCADLLISNSVLEHISDPEKVLNEASRIIKANGLFYLCVPQVCLRHHKMDYTRWTTVGLQNLLTNRGFEILEHGACRGPGWVIWHMLESLIVSRTKKGLKREFLRRLIMFITRPLVGMKVRNNEKEENMALTIYVIARKLNK